MNFKTMSKQRKFLLISSAIGFISMFLPWVSISMFGYTAGSVNGMHGKGILVFFCFLAGGGLAYFGDQAKNLDKTMWTIALLAGVIALLFIILFYSETANSIMGSSIIGYGVYIAAIASLGILGSVYLFKSPTDNLKDGFNNLKKDIESRMGNAGKTPPSDSSSISTPPPPSSSLTPPPPTKDLPDEPNDTPVI
jgi:hypothetical protein